MNKKEEEVSKEGGGKGDFVRHGLERKAGEQE